MNHNWIIIIIEFEILGAAPTIKSCGSYKFPPTMSSNEICRQIYALSENETCIPELEYDFVSMNVEVWQF